MSDTKRTDEDNTSAAPQGERDGHSQPPRTAEPSGEASSGDVAEAGERMAEDMPSETAEALERSLAVQGEREHDDDEPIGADEEE